VGPERQAAWQVKGIPVGEADSMACPVPDRSSLEYAERRFHPPTYEFNLVVDVCREGIVGQAKGDCSCRSLGGVDIKKVDFEGRISGQASAHPDPISSNRWAMEARGRPVRIRHQRGQLA